MKLTPTQLAWLKNSWNSRNTRPKFWKVFWSTKKAWWFSLPLAAAGGWLLATGGMAAGGMAVAVAWGNVFACFVLSTRAVNLWPAFREVTDWEKVEKLIRESEGNNGQLTDV
jgi:hypothetical protein